MYVGDLLGWEGVHGHRCSGISEDVAPVFGSVRVYLALYVLASI